MKADKITTWGLVGAIVGFCLYAKRNKATKVGKLQYGRISTKKYARELLLSAPNVTVNEELYKHNGAWYIAPELQQRTGITEILHKKDLDVLLRDIKSRDNGYLVADEYLLSDIPAEPEHAPIEAAKSQKKRKSKTENIREWYIAEYPTDSEGKTIPKHLTFSDLWSSIFSGIAYENILQDYDSIVRERIFSEIAKRQNIDYDVVYNTWLKNINQNIQIPFDKALKLCQKFVVDNYDVREALQFIAVKDGYLVATDGHKLIEISGLEYLQDRDNEFYLYNKKTKEFNLMPEKIAKFPNYKRVIDDALSGEVNFFDIDVAQTLELANSKKKLFLQDKKEDKYIRETWKKYTIKIGENYFTFKQIKPIMETYKSIGANQLICTIRIDKIYPAVFEYNNITCLTMPVNIVD